MSPSEKPVRRVLSALWKPALLLLVLALPLRGWALTYAPLPMYNPDKVVAETRPLLDYLSRESRRDIRIQYLESNAEVVRAFVEDRIDLAEVGPLPYLALREAAPHARALLFFLEEGGSEAYTCALVAPFDGASSVVQLAEHLPLSLAVPQRLSTCGPPAAAWMLHAAGLDARAAAFTVLGHHEAVALAVARAEFPAGTMKTLVARRYHHLGVRVLAETPPLPVFALVVNTRTLPQDLIHALQEALLRAPAEERARWVLGRHGFAPVSASSYESLERMLEALESKATDFLSP